jgi:hypothetical protein
MQILEAKHKDHTFSCFENKALYNAISILSTEDFDKIESKFNFHFNVLII